MEKTNVIRIIERKKLKYNYHFYNPETVNGAEVAAFLKEDTGKSIQNACNRWKKQ